MNTQLIKINTINLNNEEIQVVSSKDLYEFLELNPAVYSRWIKINILENKFAIENEDYSKIEVLNINVENLKSKGGRPSQDYHLKIDFAKKLCMTSKSSKGEQVRNYFIEVEKKFKNPHQLPTSYKEALQQLLMKVEENEKLQLENKEMQPKALFYDTVTQSETWLDFAEVSKVINKKNFGRNNLMKFLRQNDILRFNNTPYQSYVDRGYFKIVENTFIKNGEVCIGIKTVCSQKGIDYILKKLEV